MTQQVWWSIPPTQIYHLLPAGVRAGGLQIVYTVTKFELSREPYKVKVFLWENEIKHLTINIIF